MRVTAGPLTIADIGTVFDVATGQSGVRIAVSEGTVAVHGAAGADAVELGQGDGLIHGDGGDMRQVRWIPASSRFNPRRPRGRRR